MAHRGGFLYCFEAGGIFAPLVLAIVGSLRTGGDDESVVRKDATIGEENLLFAGVDIHGFAKEDFDVFLAAENGAEWRGDFRGGERAGGDLIEERLEEMEVALVEEGDVHVGVFEGLRGDEARETSAEDENAMGIGHGQRFSFGQAGEYGSLRTIVSIIVGGCSGKVRMRAVVGEIGGGWFS